MIGIDHVFFAEFDADGLGTGCTPIASKALATEDLKTWIRDRFPSGDAVGRDNEFAQSNTDVTRVTWEDLIKAKWPKPPNACKACNATAKKPY